MHIYIYKYMNHTCQSYMVPPNGPKTRLGAPRMDLLHTKQLPQLLGEDVEWKRAFLLSENGHC